KQRPRDIKRGRHVGCSSITTLLQAALPILPRRRWPPAKSLPTWRACMNATVLDALIIGTGQAGPSLAMRMAGAGMRTAIVEQSAFGGTCVNTGCTPTKALIASAYAAHVARRGAEYGVLLPQGDVRVDMPAVKRRRDAIVARSATSLE